MLFIQSDRKDPYFNIAAEEYFLKNFNRDVFFLYINNPSVIVGKHQNALAEINYNFIKDNALPVIRRLSGGGTVFHDAGNVNYTFIQNGQEGKLVDFKKNINPVVVALRQLGMEPEIGKRNEILLHGQKISGNAEHIFKSRILHHGTLLFDSDLEMLNKAISVKPLMFVSRAIKSVRSKVTNIKGHLENPVETHVFFRLIFDAVKKQFPEAIIYEMNETDLFEINRLVTEKYTLWDWNFGYSPVFVFQRTFKIGEARYTVNVKVNKGKIENLEILSDSISNEVRENINMLFRGVMYRKSELEKILSKQSLNISPLNLNDLIDEIHL